jgi:tRNA pseudouridine38-40 synthase
MFIGCGFSAGAGMLQTVGEFRNVADMGRHRYAIRFAYEGGSFRGFQRQSGLPTVQERLEHALAGCGVSSPLAVAARTDAGVHALAQVVSFATPDPIDPAGLRAALNLRLPAEIVCFEVREVPLEFHARASARTRTYVYLVGTPPPAGLAPYAWTLPDARAFPDVTDARLDVALTRESLSAALGEHDFAGFARAGGLGGTVKTITRAEVVRADELPLVAIVLEGTGFLRAMVRNLVGTAVTAGLRLAPPTALRDLLAKPGRYRGVRAPGWGLTLAEVGYPERLWRREPPSGPA